MRVKKKLHKLGGSRAVVLPDLWLKSIEKINNTIITHVELELNDVITIHPIIEVDASEA